MRVTGPEYGFGLYVHWPYCARICPYCDFNVYAAKGRDTAPLVEAICADIRAHRDLLPDHPPLSSVFLGGGTPSLLRAGDLTKVIETAEQTFGLHAAVEITLEANPNDILRVDASSWLEAGINRLSVGLQSLKPEALKFLGRDHSAVEAHAAIGKARQVFANISLDLIYARPGQSVQEWEVELSEVLRLGAPHLSLYELTIETATPFGKRAARGELIPLPDDDQANLYEATQILCEASGLHAYEVSNHAASPAFESRHNQIYWDSGDWIGVGPGAHGRLTTPMGRLATEASRRPEAYQAGPFHSAEYLSDDSIALEWLAMGLRSERGISLARFETAFGEPMNESLLNSLVDQNVICKTNTSIHLTKSGRLLADHISAKLIPDKGT